MELTAAEPRRHRLTQLYIDGEQAVKVDTETYLLSGLRPGDMLTDEELHALILESDARRANEKALYLLEHRDHSKKELTEKIARTAASPEAAQAAADRMEELGLVDDETYARRRAKELFTRKKFGPMRVRQELRQKGIDAGLIDQLMEEYPDSQLTENLRQQLDKKYPDWQDGEKQRRRAVHGLQRLGYPYDLIRLVMSSSDDEW